MEILSDKQICNLEGIRADLSTASDVLGGSLVELVEQAGSARPGDVALCSIAASMLVMARLLYRIVCSDGGITTFGTRGE